MRRIVTGEGFHAELLALAARFIGRGVTAASTAGTLQGLMLAHPEAARDERWHDRFASIEGLVQSAVAKRYADAAQHRRVFALQSRHALFPQVFRVVEEYVRRKVDFNGAPEPELGLEKYLRQVVERVRDAIQPDDASGEPPLLPLLNRTPRPNLDTGFGKIVLSQRLTRPRRRLSITWVGAGPRSEAQVAAGSRMLGGKAMPAALNRGPTVPVAGVRRVTC